MGGEMVYILDQRLSAQNIDGQKAVKGITNKMREKRVQLFSFDFLSVVNDIVGSMFSSKFIEELFRPQELYPKKAVKQIFEKLAHSSIMRLNEASMDKVS